MDDVMNCAAVEEFYEAGATGSLFGATPRDGDVALQDRTDGVYSIGPRTAKRMLECNISRNRPLRAGQVRKYAADMAAGKWINTGDPIRFSVGGDLIDGQHRLAAVEAAGVTVSLLVLFDLPEAAVRAIDSGAPRTLADVLCIEGALIGRATGQAAALSRTRANYYSSALRYLTFYEEGRLSALDAGGWAPSWQRILETEANHPGVRELLDSPLIRTHHAADLLGRGVSVFVLYVLSGIDRAEAEKFFEGVATGANLATDDPAMQLRMRLERATGPAGTRRFTVAERIALAFTAWNFHASGKRCSKLMLPRRRPFRNPPKTSDEGGRLAPKPLEFPKPKVPARKAKA